MKNDIVDHKTTINAIELEKNAKTDQTTSTSYT
jgi:hypothetical protein